MFGIAVKQVRKHYLPDGIRCVSVGLFSKLPKEESIASFLLLKFIAQVSVGQVIGAKTLPIWILAQR